MIKIIKRFLLVILALVVAAFFAGCGTYIYAPNRPSGGNDTTQGGGQGGNQGGGNQGDDDNDNQGGGNQGGGNQGGDNGGGEDEVRVFTVTLIKEGQVYTNTDGIKAQWVSKYGVYVADFVNGVATITGLDGEYHVTLSALPKESYTEYTYDCNGYIATNNKRDIKIELLEILKAYPVLQGWREITKLGTYRATINSRSTEDMYYFYPREDGWYSITSWVDTTANKVNPKVNIYNGNANSGFKVLSQTVDKGGSGGTYTKNFRFEVKINWDEVGNNQIFGVMADAASTSDYPVTVDFTVKYEGEYLREDFGEPVYANGPFLNTKPTGGFRYAYTDNYKGVSNGYATYTLDGSKVRLKESGEGAGFYHLYDEVKYASNGGYGPMLFAKLTKDTEVMWTMDDKGNHVDGGFNWNTTLTGGFISCVINGYDYAYMITSSKDDDGVSHVGYANYCNADGVHPVTEEIKNFLQGYASREWFFDDGEGWAENGRLNEILNSTGTSVVKAGINLQSSENDQWLFACGYYR